MAVHNDLGKTGEYEALLYLMNEGYTLHEKNWREGHLEIDIVAEWWGEIVFVEVKTRRDERFARAAEAVNLQKKTNLIEAAHAYIDHHGLFFQPYRYDIITVIGTERPFKIAHIKNAYTEQGVWKSKHGQKGNDFKV